MDNKKVLAVVAGKAITEEEIDMLLKSLPKEQQVYSTNEQFRKQCLEQLISLHLFAKHGEDLQLEETEEYKKIMDSARTEALAQLAMAETMKGIAVTDEEVKEYYENHSAQFQRGATVQAKHILVAEEEKCKDILEAVQKEEKTFEDAAKEFSTCPSGQKGGDLGEFGKGQMVKEFEDAAFAAEIGQVVGPVKTQFGYHLIKVERKNPEQTIAFEEVQENIRKSLIQQKQQAVYMGKIKELREKYVEE